MKLTITGKNFDVTGALKEHIQKRFGKLDRYVDESVEAQVTLSVAKESHTVEITVFLNGGILIRGEETTGDMYASIDGAVEKVEKQIKKHKSKINQKIRQSGGDNVLKGETNKTQESDDPRIVKTKRFAIKPMSPEEAVLQMELLGHDFFVFRNAETEEVNVVYSRKDGNYGQIEPEV